MKCAVSTEATATLLKVTLLHGCFSRFQNCTDGTKSGKASDMLQPIYFDREMGFINVSVEVVFVQFLPKVAAEDKRKFGLW